MFSGSIRFISLQQLSLAISSSYTSYLGNKKHGNKKLSISIRISHIQNKGIMIIYGTIYGAMYGRIYGTIYGTLNLSIHHYGIHNSGAGASIVVNAVS